MASQVSSETIVIDDVSSGPTIPLWGLSEKLAPLDWRSSPHEVSGRVVFEKLVLTDTSERVSEFRALADEAHKMKAAAVVVGTTEETVGELKGFSTPLPVVFCTDEALIHQLHGGLGQKKVLLTPLSPGDHIRRLVVGALSSVGYHHGIYVGGGQVVHFANETLECGMVGGGKQAKILNETIEEFRMGHCSIEVVGGCYDDKAIVVMRALLAFRTDIYPTRYHLLKNNCEHFTRWCCTGIQTSSQADIVSKAVVGGSAALAIAVLEAPLLGAIAVAGLVMECIANAVGFISSKNSLLGAIAVAGLVMECIANAVGFISSKN